MSTVLVSLFVSPANKFFVVITFLHLILAKRLTNQGTLINTNIFSNFNTKNFSLIFIVELLLQYFSNLNDLKTVKDTKSKRKLKVKKAFIELKIVVVTYIRHEELSIKCLLPHFSRIIIRFARVTLQGQHFKISWLLLLALSEVYETKGLNYV